MGEHKITEKIWFPADNCRPDNYVEEPTDPIFDASNQSARLGLTVEVPLENRLTFIEKTPEELPWLPVGELSVRLGKYVRWVERMVAELALPTQAGDAGGQYAALYPPYTLGILKEELAWRELFHALPSHLKISEVTEQTGRSRGWTVKTLDELSIRPGRSETHGRGMLYPKSVLKKLRKINMSVPLDDGWYSIGQLLVHSEVDREWALRRLGEAGYDPERRRSTLTGRILEHYAPEALEHIIKSKEDRPVPGGAWLTAEALIAVTGRSRNWLEPRLQHHIDIAEPKQDDQGVTRAHYPPQVVASLQRAAEQHDAIPEVGDYLNLSLVCRKVGHTALTTKGIFDELGITAEPRRDKVGRIGWYYSPKVVEQVKQAAAVVKEQAPLLSEKLQAATFALGSIRSQIRARKQLLQTLSTYGEAASQTQRLVLEADVAILKLQRKQAENHQNRLISKRNKASGV